LRVFSQQYSFSRRPALDKYHQGYQRYPRAHDEEIARTQAETQTIPKQHRPLPVPESMANPSAIILVAQMPRLRKIDSCPPKKFSSYLILPVPFRDRPPVPTRRAPRRITKRRDSKGRSGNRAAFSALADVALNAAGVADSAQFGFG
jgi:hypothetical protein